MITDYFRYDWPRWYIVRLCTKLRYGRVYDWLLDFLYPSDAIVEFKE